jgi:hypothetical protein
MFDRPKVKRGAVKCFSHIASEGEEKAVNQGKSTPTHQPQSTTNDNERELPKRPQPTVSGKMDYDSDLDSSDNDTRSPVANGELSVQADVHAPSQLSNSRTAVFILSGKDLKNGGGNDVSKEAPKVDVTANTQQHVRHEGGVRSPIHSARSSASSRSDVSLHRFDVVGGSDHSDGEKSKIENKKKTLVKTAKKKEKQKSPDGAVQRSSSSSSSGELTRPRLVVVLIRPIRIERIIVQPIIFERFSIFDQTKFV